MWSDTKVSDFEWHDINELIKEKRSQDISYLRWVISECKDRLSELEVIINKPSHDKWEVKNKVLDINVLHKELLRMSNISWLWTKADEELKEEVEKED